MKKAYPLQGGDAKPPVSSNTRGDSGAAELADRTTSPKFPTSNSVILGQLPVAIARITRREALGMTARGSVAMSFFPALLLAGCGGGGGSSASTSTLQTTVGAVLPNVPATPTAGAVSAFEVSLRWTASSDTGGPGIKSYDVQRNGSVVATVGDTSYTDAGLTASTTYTYAIRARDIAGAVSTFSASMNATTASSSTVYFGATLPTLPRATVDTALTIPAASATPRGSYFTPGHGGDASLTVQSAIDSATYGDVIVLQAGTAYTGKFVLPHRGGGSKYTYIVSSGCPEIGGSSLPAAGTRVTSNAGMAAILCPGNTGYYTPSVYADNGADHYRFIGIEFTAPSAAVDPSYWMVQFGDNSTIAVAADIPHHIIMDRCFVHPNDMTGDTTAAGMVIHAVVVNCNSFAIIQSRIENIYAAGYDSQTLNIISSSGPILIHDNYLEACGENILFGGGLPAHGLVSAGGIVPSDITITNNHVYKRTSWITAKVNGTSLDVKNCIEFKCASRVLVDSNYILNHWSAAQQFAMALTPRTNSGGGAGPPYYSWCVVEDITITNNNFDQVYGVLNMIGSDNLDNSGHTDRVLFRNNFVLLADLTNATGAQRAFQGGYGPSNPLGGAPVSIGNVIVDHNTVVGIPHATGSTMFAFDDNSRKDFSPLVFTNNVLVATTYGILASGGGSGEAALTGGCTAWNWSQNVILQASGSSWPPSTHFSPSSSVGFSNTSLGTPGGYALTTSAVFATSGVTGAGHSISSSGTADSTPLGMSNHLAIPVG